jgi:ABC-type multidrug transport system fused ATPase/permease subunit
MPRWAGDRNPLVTLSRSSVRTSCRRYYQVSISVALAATVVTQFAAPLREIHRMRDEANEATIHVRQAFEILDDPIDPYFVRKAISQNATNVQIELRDVRVEYSGGIVAAEGVTFKVLQGQFFGLCGPAGSGKTSIMKSIAGLLPRMEHDRWMAASKQAGVPTARNGPPERIPTCDWDAGISEREKETNRMFVRGVF